MAAPHPGRSERFQAAVPQPPTTLQPHHSDLRTRQLPDDDDDDDDDAVLR